MSIILGLLIPFVGTTAGAGCVFFLKKQLGPLVKKMCIRDRAEGRNRYHHFVGSNSGYGTAE